ncbi:hypothetical protein, partial [uncultured Chryseobacterium sp.]|uniref:hypothetical protein n=1 Tax=uncultured Chryseobacterium sp. TaxID=259322 RepID=UPI003748D517
LQVPGTVCFVDCPNLLACLKAMFLVFLKRFPGALWRGKEPGNQKGSKYWPPGTGKQEAYTAATAGTLQKNTFHTLHDTYVLGWLRIMWRTRRNKTA